MKRIKYDFMTLLVSWIMGLLLVGTSCLWASCSPNEKEDPPKILYVTPHVIYCINGHRYYSLHPHRLAIQLDDDGKPVKCKVEKEK